MEKTQRDKSYDFIRAFAMILIVVWHFWTTCRSLGTPLALKPLCELTGMQEMLNEGGIGVALFFILSGAVLMTRYRDEIKVGQFFKRRVVRIFIPFWIAFAVFFVISCLLLKSSWSELNNIGVFWSLMGLDLFGGAGLPTFWLVGEWFTTVIIIMYVIFPLLRLLLKKIPVLTTILIVLLFVLNLHFKIATYGDGWFSITNSLLVFWIGMLIGYYKPKFKWGMFYCGIIGMILTLVLLKQINELMFYLPTVLFSTFLFMIMGVINYSNKLTNFLSKYNFEIYLVHHRILIWIIPLMQYSFSSTLKELLLFVIIFWFICCCSKLLNVLVSWLDKFGGWLKVLREKNKNKRKL